jgi:thiol-disulfide isomerase/thioredoxin
VVQYGRAVAFRLNLLTGKCMRFAIALLFVVAVDPPTSHSAIAVIILKNTNMEGRLTSRVDVEYGLEDTLESKEKVFVLFYASWCPFSQRFLPIFEKFAKDKNRRCSRIVTDDKASLCEKYSVEVVPTVVVFEKGKVTGRLDGVLGIGLSEKQFKDFVNTC